MKNREWFLERACINLLKMNNFKELVYLLDSKQITEEEYDTEIDTNEDKYVISSDEEIIDINSEDFKTLYEIVNKLLVYNKDLYVDDVELLFGIKLKNE